MHYEFLIQPREVGWPFDPSAVLQSLEALGPVQGEEGAREWKLPEGRVEVSRVAERGTVVALALRVPVSDRTELVTAVVVKVAPVVQATGLRFFDPQLLRDVGPSSEAAVVEQFLRTARWAGAYLGTPGAVGAAFDPPEPMRIKPGVKVLAALIGVLVLLIWLSSFLVPKFEPPPELPGWVLERMDGGR